MKRTRLIMGMPITVCITERQADPIDIEDIFRYFKYVDARFSPFKPESEVSQVNNGQVDMKNTSDEMKSIVRWARETKTQTKGYFDVYHKGRFDPSGLVKGWAVSNAARLLADKGYINYYIDAGGDIQTSGVNEIGRPWRVGIRNPFNRYQNVKVVDLNNMAIATSGTYIRGQHVYDPVAGTEKLDQVVSITVIGEDIFDADRLATAAFAMGVKGIHFIESLAGYEAYMIDRDGKATFTSKFKDYVQPA